MGRGKKKARRGIANTNAFFNTPSAASSPQPASTESAAPNPQNCAAGHGGIGGHAKRTDSLPCCSCFECVNWHIIEGKFVGVDIDAPGVNQESLDKFGPLMPNKDCSNMPGSPLASDDVKGKGKGANAGEAAAGASKKKKRDKKEKCKKAAATTGEDAVGDKENEEGYVGKPGLTAAASAEMAKEHGKIDELSEIPGDIKDTAESSKAAEAGKTDATTAEKGKQKEEAAKPSKFVEKFEDVAEGSKAAEAGKIDITPSKDEKKEGTADSGEAVEVENTDTAATEKGKEKEVAPKSGKAATVSSEKKLAELIKIKDDTKQPGFVRKTAYMDEVKLKVESLNEALCNAIRDVRLFNAEEHWGLVEEGIA